MIYRRFSIILFFILLLNNGLFSQDPHFSQFYANPLYLNPAFTGTAICPRLIMNYRSQWPSITGTYSTYSAGYDQHVDALSGGVGVSFFTDRAGEGTIITNNVSILYAYTLQVNRHISIKAGFQASYFQNKLDWDKLTFGDMIDAKYGFVKNTDEARPAQGDLTRTSTDFASGLLVYSENFFGGFAVHHLTEPRIGFVTPSKLPMKITVHAGGIIDVGHKRKRRRSPEDPTISPNILFMQQQDFQEFNYGLYFNKFPIIGGIWFRQNINTNADALILLVGVQTDVIKFGYSYDITVSKLSNASGGSHEVSLALQFACKAKSKRIRAINCPSF